MRNYTTIEQSKQLAKILPIESADMYYYEKDAFDGAMSAFNGAVLVRQPDEPIPDKAFPCWSLGALLETLPPTIATTKINRRKYYLTIDIATSFGTKSYQVSYKNFIDCLFIVGSTVSLTEACVEACVSISKSLQLFNHK